MSLKNCVKKYVKCPTSKRCRVKTGKCVTSKPTDDLKYDFAGKKFYITPGEGHEDILEKEYGVARRRSTRKTKSPERIGVVTGSKYRRGIRRGIKMEELSRKESEIIKKFAALDLDLQDELVSSPQKEFEMTIRDLDIADGFIFPEVPFQASPTNMSESELKLLKRLRALELPLGAPPSPPRGILGSSPKMTKDAKLDQRRLTLYQDTLFPDDDSDNDDGDEYVPAF